MKFFEGIYAATSRASFGALDFLLNHTFSFQSVWFFLVGLTGVAGFFLGRRLRRFNHPDFPLGSPVIRIFLGSALFLLGCVCIAGVLGLALVTIGLTLLGSMAMAGLEQTDIWPVFQSYMLKIWPWVHQPARASAAGAIVGTAVALILTMRTIPRLERGQGLRDVRYMQKTFARMRTFSPLNHINVKKGIFIGLEDGKHPVYIPLEQFHETHTQIIGASGSGKGIALGLLGFQFVIAGGCVIAIDPKGDRRLPLVLSMAAKKAGVRFRHLDLNPESPPQFNLVAGAKQHEIEELLVGGLGIQPTAGDGNYYRGIDQDAAEAVALRAALIENPSLTTLLEIAQQDETLCKADNFVRRLRQVCQLPVIQTSYDFDLHGLIERGEVLYVRGSTDNHRVKSLQSMLLIRILQIVKARGAGRKITLILDEFKHLLSTVSLDALGTVRELGCHALLAHQSMGDLGGCPGLRREDVEPRVVDNTTLKLVYRLNDAKASADFAARSGKQRTHAEGVRGLDQDNKDQRTWTEVQQFRMSEDLFTHLHRPSDGKEIVAAGVLFGYKTARLIAVSPINVEGSIPPLEFAPAETISKPTAIEALI